MTAPAEREVKQIERMFDRVAADMAAELNAKGITDPETRNMFITQNVLRRCMEICLNRSLPYGKTFLLEIGSRMAAYAITAAPMPDHEIMTAQIQQTLPMFVARKMATGAIIKTEWESDAPPPADQTRQ